MSTNDEYTRYNDTSVRTIVSFVVVVVVVVAQKISFSETIEKRHPVPIQPVLGRRASVRDTAEPKQTGVSATLETAAR